MESEGDEPSIQHSKLKNHSRFSSISMQDSSSTIANLPSNFLIEIYLRLHVKSLVQWLDLISRPRFIKSHISLGTSTRKTPTIGLW